MRFEYKILLTAVLFIAVWMSPLFLEPASLYRYALEEFRVLVVGLVVGYLLGYIVETNKRRGGE